MTHTNILDELLFVPGALPSIGPPQSSDLSIALPIRDGKRHLRVGSPWFVRELTGNLVGKSWNTICGLLKAAEIPIFATCESLETVSAVAVPKRYAKRFSNEPLVALELKTADAFELDCRDSASLRWAWPTEFATSASLATFVQAVRMAAGGTTPIGIGLPVGADSVDLRKAQSAQADFLVLNDDVGSLESGGELLVESLTTARQIFAESQQATFPILVVTNLAKVDDGLKLLALGATAINVDGLVKVSLSKTKAKDLALGGMLSGIGAVEEKLDFAPLEQLLSAMRQRLDLQMQNANAANLSQFGSQTLRAVTDNAARITGVRLLRA